MLADICNVFEGAIDIAFFWRTDYWHWIDDFGIIDIAIDIETGQWLYATIDIDIEVTTIDPIIKSQ